MKKNLILSAFAIALCMSSAQKAAAQDIIGTIKDQSTGDAVSGASIEAVGTGRKAISGNDGSFHITGLVKGKKYALTFQVLAYKSKRIDGVVALPASQAQALSVILEPNEQTLAEASVTEVARINTEAAVTQQTKNSSVIVSNVSAQEIKRTQDSNAGEVIRRVPGVSLIDDKFVMVRGLSQRYNNVWINGGAVPSSEADTRAFSFDMLPSSQIDNLSIVKTPTAEYPADYTGGFILINTKDIPSANELHISVGGNWNTGTVFRNFYAPNASGTDWLGFDNGLRSLSGGIDANLKTLGTNAGGNTMYDLASNGLNNKWGINKSTPFADLKIGADWSRKWNIGESRLGMTSAINYTNEHRTYRGMINNFYDAYDVENDRSNPLRLSTDNQYNHNVRLGAMVNFTLLSSSGKNKYQLKNIFNQIGNSRYTSRQGTSAQSEPERSAEYYYRSRTTYNGQVTGRHTFTRDAFDWSAGYAYANRRLPDRRKYILYNEDNDNTDNYIWLYQNDISREWTSLDEHIMSVQANDEHQFTFGSWEPKLKVGAYGEYRTRDYKTRNFFYWYSSTNTLPSGFRSMDMPTLLSDASNYGADKLYLLEDVNKINDYSGNNSLIAGYASASLPFGKLSALVGVRYEWDKMVLITNTQANKVSHKKHYYRHNDLFPSLNLTYKFNDEHQLRLAYGRSVNRPEFRELSPSVYYDFDLASDVQGNYDLKNCYVDNVDLRWEWYPSRGEFISVAAFYKHFDSPIEWVYTMAGGTNVIYSYKNAKAANNYGIEVDIRKRLDFIGLPDFSWSFNGALIHSRVKFAPGSVEYDRPMQGQSPYLINTGLFYKNEKARLDLGLLYNRIGKRIVGVGRTEGGGDAKNVRVPDSYEMPRHTLDFTASKHFGEHFELKFAYRDILNQSILYKQFSDVTYSDGTTKEIQQVTRKYKPGSNISLSLIWKL